ncbi:MAG: hypothetical protein IJ605_06745 [Prevotella sp.]|nr:hypothetical protein [Prevotella sp.]
MKANTTGTSAGNVYRSLDEIRDRKDQLLDQIRKDDRQIKTLWGQLFAKPEPLSALSPSKRISSLMTTGAGVFDGILLGWKLYRKFKKKKK